MQRGILAWATLSVLVAAGCSGSGEGTLPGEGSPYAGYDWSRGRPDASSDAAPRTGTFANAEEEPRASGPSEGASGVPSGSTPTSPSPARPSSGCSRSDIHTGSQSVALESEGIARSSILYVPGTVTAGVPAPLILNLHGFGSDDWQQVILTRMNEVADTRGIIVAYPKGLAMSWNAGQCCGASWIDAANDVDFLRALVKRVGADHCIDESRVYVTGMSNGGFMAYRAVCQMSDVIAAAAPVSGVLGSDPVSCTPTHPVPILHFHGTADPIVPYEGGYPVLKTNWEGDLNFRSAPDTIDAFRAKYGCERNTETTYQKGDATCERWLHCKPGTELEFCTIDGGGHTWPGGTPIPTGKTSRDVDATRRIVDFFLRYQRN